MIRLDDSHFRDLGDTVWWRCRLQDYGLPFELGRHGMDTNCVIYDPNISKALGQMGIELVKRGAFMELMPRDSIVLISTVQEPICAPGPYPWDENVDVPSVIAAGCESLGLDANSFAYASGDRRVADFNTTGIRSFFVPGWNHLFWSDERLARDAIDPLHRTCDHTFLSFNRIVRTHRFYFICRLAQEGMLDGNLVSCPASMYSRSFTEWGVDIHGNVRDHMAAHDPHGLLDWDRLHATAAGLMPRLPLVLDVDDLGSNGCYESDTLASSIPFYQSSFMSVVTESSAHGPGCYPSETIFRPIIFQQPFLAIAQPGLLALLREWGFDTFDDLFDNSYDLEPCQYRRVELIIDNIRRFEAMDPSSLRSITADLSPRLRANMERYFGAEFKAITREYVLDVYNWLHEKQHP